MPPSLVADAFDVAKNEFLLKFKKTPKYDFSKLSSIDDVYNATEEIQKKQAAQGALRNLRKIQPFLDGLSKYEKVIETFVQAKPDVLALIWGPIRFILVIAQSHLKTYERILDAMAQIGAVLPNFQLYTGIFENNHQIHQTLCLFFQDILDFHGTVVSFFNLKGWKEMFEILWPKYGGRFEVILDNIKKHTMLMHDEVEMAHIAEADAARKLALQEYERAHESQDRQKFDSVISSFNPDLYDKELERLSTECSAGTGGWLAGHSAYTKWFDAANDDIRLFWVQGIPGAGKSHLSSVIIREIKARGQQIAFAFLTYHHRHNISALRILHSFMYQVILENKSLRPVLTSAHDEHYRQLNSSVSFARDILCDLIRHQPVMYIVVDGLDEITMSERTLLVKTLLQMQTEVKTLKVLFSSRAEDDLTRLLNAKADSVRVHDNNSPDLAHYVHQKADEFVTEMGVESVVASEVHRLMKIVAEKAGGMFLYARLLCVILAEQSSLDAMKHEINTLPQGLDAAYQRIIERIESDMGNSAREEARTILELVSCSAVPLSKNEIQLAVLVARGGDPSQGCRSMFLNLIQRCGPIIEEVDGKIQFVHHTAEQYLFSAHSNEYLSKAGSHRDIASICTKYLASPCFSTELSDAKIRERLLSGVYVLENFACTSWLYHLEKAGEHEENDLLPYVMNLLEQRTNQAYIRPNAAEADQLDSFRAVAPDVHKQLWDVKVFLRNRWEDLCFDNGDEWRDSDPLSLSRTQIRIRRLLEDSLCVSETHNDNCTCDTLKVLYGPRIFKCSWPGCSLFRSGFETRDQRDRHSKMHQRPFKCDYKDCSFSELGFQTQSLLHSHLDRYHGKQSTVKSISTVGISNNDEMKMVLIDAMKSRDLGFVDSILSSLEDKIILSHSEAEELVKSQLLTVSIFFRVFDNPKVISRWAKAPYSLPTMSFLIQSYNSDEEERAIVYRLAGGCFAPAEAYRLAATRGSLDIVSELKKGGQEGRNPFWKGLIPSKPDLELEAFALQCFRLFSTDSTTTQRTWALRRVAESCCSIPLARFLVEKGVDIKETARRPDTRPLLLLATRKNTLESIEMTRFLIGRGADTTVTHNGWRLQDTPAGKNVQKWTGTSWGEFVADAQNSAG